MTVDGLAKRLNISRAAAHQHVISLEHHGYIEAQTLAKTGGRPGRAYVLTQQGVDQFPKHYALISTLLVGLMKEQIGAPTMLNCLKQLGQSLAAQFSSRVADKSSNDKVTETAAIMHELGYEIESVIANDTQAEIVAQNCVFHELAQEHNEVCELDIALMETLTESTVEQKECMAKGQPCCRFAICKKA